MKQPYDHSPRTFETIMNSILDPFIRISFVPPIKKKKRRKKKESLLIWQQGRSTFANACAQPWTLPVELDNNKVQTKPTAVARREKNRRTRGRVSLSDAEAPFESIITHLVEQKQGAIVESSRETEGRELENEARVWLIDTRAVTRSKSRAPVLRRYLSLCSLATRLPHRRRHVDASLQLGELK